MEILTYNVPLWLVICLLLFVVYIIYMSWNFRIFKKMGVKGPAPIPVFGNFIQQGKLGVQAADEMWMKEYGKVWGIFEGKDPNLFIADEEMLSQLFVKKFSCFTDKRTVEGFTGDMQYSVMELKGDKWKKARTVLTPTFSAGKLRKMTPLITKTTEHLLENLNQNLRENSEMDMKKVYGSFTMDVISSTAFGIKTNSQKNPDDPFVKNLSSLVHFSFFSPIMFLIFLAPFLLKPLNMIMNISFIPPKIQKFFRDVVVKEINNRKTAREDYVDFMQLMIQAHGDDPKETNSGMSFRAILGNSLVFFVAGYDSTATTLSLFSYVMALHPDIQEKVYEEIVREIADEEPGYDDINKLCYMDMCVTETMRLFPPATRTDRVCTAETDLGGLKIPKGMIISIPIWAIHRCAENWPNPETYDPERFSPENKGKHSPFHYLPFGYGPRNCIGMRLAIMELKLTLVIVMRQFKFSVGEKTSIPPVFDDAGLLSPKELWLKVEKR